MLKKFLFIFLVFVCVATFSALNWSAIAAPTNISLGIMSIFAPLGIVLLGLTALQLLVFLFYMAVWQGQILKGARRHQKELQEHRDLVHEAEESRFTELKKTMLAEFQKLTTELKQGEATLSLELREQSNSLAAMLGEMDDRAKQ